MTTTRGHIVAAHTSDRINRNSFARLQEQGGMSGYIIHFHNAVKVNDNTYGAAAYVPVALEPLARQHFRTDVTFDFDIDQDNRPVATDIRYG